MNLQYNFSRGVAWMTMGNWSEQALNLLVFAILLRLLGEEAFGVLAMAMAPILICEGLVRETLADYLFSITRVTDELINALFWVILVFGLSLGVVLVALAPVLADFYGIPTVHEILWAATIIVPLTAAAELPVALLRKRMNIRPLALRAFFGVLIGGLFGVAMALAGYGVWALVVQRLVLTVVNVAIALWAAKWRPGPWPGLETLREARPFIRSILIMRLAEMGNLQLPSVIVGAVLGPYALGYYVIAWRLVELGSFLIATPVRMSALPAFVRTPEKTRGPTGMFHDTLRLVGFISIPAFVGMALMAPQVLLVFGGQNWVPAAPALAVLCGLGILLCLNKIEDAYAVAQGHARTLAAIGMVNLFLTLGAMWLLSGWGLEGMTAAMFLAAVMVQPLRIMLVAGASQTSFWLFYRQQLGPIVASFVMVIATYPLLPWFEELPVLIALFLGALFGGTVYFGIAIWRMKRRLAMARDYLESLRYGRS